MSLSPPLTLRMNGLIEMKLFKQFLILYPLSLLLSASAASPESLFDGMTLNGWNGDMKVWSVVDGAITAKSEPGAPLDYNTFLVWQGGDIENFELTYKTRIFSGNSGVQYRSHIIDQEKWIIGGYQADIAAKPLDANGKLYEEKGRGRVCLLGQKVITGKTKKNKQVLDLVEKPLDILKGLNPNEWNEHTIIADGNHLIHKINGKITADIFDNNVEKRASKGLLALQSHGKMDMHVQFKDIVLSKLPASKPAERALSAAEIKVKDGFTVELLHSVPYEEQGSWVCITADNKGRLITSDQYGHLFRITPSEPGKPLSPTAIETLNIPFGCVQGLAFVKGDLYAIVSEIPEPWRQHVIPKRAKGLYRLRDTNKDDQFDEIVRLRTMAGQGEHGLHALIPSPDEKYLYIVVGNSTAEARTSPGSMVPPVWQEDNILPQVMNPTRHNSSRMLPCGRVIRTDLQGNRWDFLSMGSRNIYDIAINEEGEIFGYDSDKEWDLGLPWYRPTRIVHHLSGSDFGYRIGSGKWPEYYIDSLPAVVNVGPGSPAGLLFGKSSKFPEKYQKALFGLDWTFGTIYAFHLKPEGASYTAEKEEFISGKPLPVTDAVIGKDGAMYFTTGGRRLQSGLYRVYYSGEEKGNRGLMNFEINAGLRKLRRSLEAYHGKKNEAAIDAAWQHMGHPDRFIRHAARIAIEHQPVKTWFNLITADQQPQLLLNALTALARHGDSKLQDRALDLINSINLDELHDELKLDWLRTLELICIRMGMPPDSTIRKLSNKLHSIFPSDNYYINREASALLVYFQDPGVIKKALDLIKKSPTEIDDIDTSILDRGDHYGRTIQAMLKNPPKIQNLQFAKALRLQKKGWTPETRKEYFTWLGKAITDKSSGGASYKEYVKRFVVDALKNVPDSESKQINSIIEKAYEEAARADSNIPVAKGPGRMWTSQAVADVVKGKLKGRDFKNGKNMYKAAMCYQCHRLAGEGGSIGPDLTNAAGKFSAYDMATAIMNPNETISDQFANSVIELSNGYVVTGRIVTKNKHKIQVAENPYNNKHLTTVKTGDIVSTKISPYSPMPPGLINMLNENELLDLFAYIFSGGNRNDKAFSQ